MDEDNITNAIMIGVSTLIGIMTISAIIIFFNSSINGVRNISNRGLNINNISRNDIESTLLMSGTGNYIKGTSVINLLSYYEQNTLVTIDIQNIKYIDNNGNISTIGDISIDSTDGNVRQSRYNTALRYIMDNQDFTIDSQDIDQDAGSRIITIKGV